MRRDKIAAVLGAIVVGILLLLIFLPDSLWQSSTVGPASERKDMINLALPDLNGQVWRLKEQQGKVVLVNFWATWCGPCRVETPELVKLANNYKAEGLEVVGISLDEGGDEIIRQFVSSYRVPYPILRPTRESGIASAIQSIPTTLLIDRQGRVAKSYVGLVPESVLTADVKSLLAE